MSFSFGAAAVLKNIAFTAESGAIVGLIGPNGAGKTTLLRCLAGLLTASGQVAYRGVPLTRLGARQRAAARAFVGQQVPAGLPYKVLSLVAQAKAFHHPFFVAPKVPELVRAALDDVGYHDSLTRDFATLSGGARQQVMLARAFLQDTPLLLLDEPTSFLDLQHRVALSQALRRRAHMKVCVVLSLHDINLAAQLCDRLLLLHQGRQVMWGTPHEVVRAEILQPVYQTSLWCGVHPRSGLPLVEPDLFTVDLTQR